MGRQISQKTFKMELEFTVAMDEVEEEHLGKQGQNHSLTTLKRLQQALTQNETALTSQMLSALMGKLQGYADYLAAQDAITCLASVAAGLEPEAGENINPAGDDLADLTRPIRVSCMSVQIDSSAIAEKVESPEAEPAWEPVWSDLRRGTESGKQWERFSIPSAPVPYTTNQGASHYLLVRYFTRQKDGVHIEGRCTCQQVMAGVGEDEHLAMDALWRSYQKHIERTRKARQLQLGLGRAFWKS